MTKWYDRIGNTIEMKVGSKWVKGVIVEGYRTHDGAVNMQTLAGKKYWCYTNAEDLHFRKCEGSKGDLITNADRIRAMSDEELIDFLCSIETYEEGSAMTIEGGIAMCSVSDVKKWLQEELEE